MVIVIVLYKGDSDSVIYECYIRVIVLYKSDIDSVI